MKVFFYNLMFLRVRILLINSDIYIYIYITLWKNVSNIIKVIKIIIIKNIKKCSKF